MTSPQSPLRHKILALIGDDPVPEADLVLKTGMGYMGVRSVLNAMVRCGMIWRVTRKDKTRAYHLPPEKYRDKAHAPISSQR